ncbi:MAG: hypothetical protein H6774_04385 [Pseudomonadales bacterium]|nr:hypothetical protein [Candidatus Woesebacteria bacterium]MCB9802297.1 hypothetical protein [Pseudomonadales bacterium]
MHTYTSIHDVVTETIAELCGLESFEVRPEDSLEEDLGIAPQDLKVLRSILEKKLRLDHLDDTVLYQEAETVAQLAELVSEEVELG